MNKQSENWFESGGSAVLESDDQLAQQTLERPDQNQVDKVSLDQPIFQSLNSGVAKSEVKPNTFERQGNFKLTRAMIESAGSIAQLQEILNQAVEVGAMVPGNKEINEDDNYSPADVKKRIKNFADFYNLNKENLAISALNGKKGQANIYLNMHLINIPSGLGLRDKAFALMAEEWKKYFQENKVELNTWAIQQSTTVSELCTVIEHWQKIIKYQDKEYSRDGIIGIIKNAEKMLEITADIGQFSKDKEELAKELNKEIRSVLPQGSVPNELGIYQKAFSLIFTMMNGRINAKKETKIQNYISKVSGSSEEGKSRGWFSRITNSRGWFSRK
ncbi:MAG: hypothetical protein WC508_04740 [Patescibacteria group bacterium]